MLRFKVAALAGVTVLISGCVGPNPGLGVVDPAESSSETRTAAASVRVLSQNPPKATIAGPVEAASCKNKLWDPDPSEENALAQLKIKAAELGATAIVGVKYIPDGTSYWTNCWSIIVAKGVAIK